MPWEQQRQNCIREHLLLCAQRDHRVDTSGAVGRHARRARGDGHEQKGHAPKDDDVVWMHINEQSSHETGERHGQRQANGNPDKARPHGVSEHESHGASRRLAQRQPNTDFTSAPAYAIGAHA